MGDLFARGNRGLLLLLALTLLLTILQFGKTPFFEPDEGRYSEIPREMLATGDFLTPHLNGVLYFEKPPLLYWLVAGSMALLGENEWAARLPGMLATVGMILMAAAFAGRRWGSRTGLLAGLVTGSSVLVLALARIVITDAILSFILTGAVFAFVAFQEAEQEGNARRARRALYGLHVACALAVLAKGLIGFLLPGGAIFLFIALSGRWRLLPRLFSPGPLMVFLLIALPWHVAMARRNPDFLDFYFVEQHFRRFFTKYYRRQGSSFYFVGVLLAGFLPWTGFFGRFRETFPTRRSAFRERPTESFLWIWALLVFLFFTASKSKLIPYVEPIWASLGVLLARRHREGATERDRFPDRASPLGLSPRGALGGRALPRHRAGILLGLGRRKARRRRPLRPPRRRRGLPRPAARRPSLGAVGRAVASRPGPGDRGALARLRLRPPPDPAGGRAGDDALADRLDPPARDEARRSAHPERPLPAGDALLHEALRPGHRPRMARAQLRQHPRGLGGALPDAGGVPQDCGTAPGGSS